MLYIVQTHLMVLVEFSIYVPTPGGQYTNSREKEGQSVVQLTPQLSDGSLVFCSGNLFLLMRQQNLKEISLGRCLMTLCQDGSGSSLSLAQLHWLLVSFLIQQLYPYQSCFKNASPMLYLTPLALRHLPHWFTPAHRLPKLPQGMQ